MTIKKQRFQVLSDVFPLHQAIRLFLRSEFGSVRKFGKSINMSHTSVYEAINNENEKSLRGRIVEGLGFDPWS